MDTFYIVQTGGKQYIAKKGAHIVVDSIAGAVGDTVTINTVGSFTHDGSMFSTQKNTVSAKILEQGRGLKLRVAKFKAKVRYRKVTGFKATLSKIEIIG